MLNIGGGGVRDEGEKMEISVISGEKTMIRGRKKIRKIIAISRQSRKWNDETAQTANITMPPSSMGSRMHLHIAVRLINDGLNNIFCKITIF